MSGWDIKRFSPTRREGAKYFEVSERLHKQGAKFLKDKAAPFGMNKENSRNP